MPNEVQLRRLKEEDVEVWNEWRKSNPDIVPDLTEANLWHANLEKANLEKANLREADLRYASLGYANLSGANLSGADLSGADLSGADLEEADLGFADLEEADLSGADLRYASLGEADLWVADLEEADLEEANLSRVMGLGTTFKGATLTGACIEDWNINSETNLEGVICDYIYLKEGQQERRPSDPKRNFEPGEFTKLFQKALETVDLIFSEGIDWRATAYSIKNTQVLNQDTPLAIQSIENKGDGVVLIKVNVPKNANKGKIEGDFWQGYEFANKALKEQYEARLLDKDKTINQLFYSLNQAQEKLGEVPRLMAENPRKVSKFEIHNSPISGLVDANQVEASQIGGNITYTLEQKQTLAEAAEEIQKLLKQLEQTNPTATPEQQQAYVDAAIPPTLKERCIGALKAGGEASIEEFLDNPYVNIGKAVVKGWMKAE